MGNPIDKLKKIKGRSWDELRTRGGQAFSVYSEQIGLSGKMPTDAEFAAAYRQIFFRQITHYRRGTVGKVF